MPREKILRACDTIEAELEERVKYFKGEDVRYGYLLAEIIDPYEGYVKETITAPTDGIVFFAHTEPLISQGGIAYRLIHRLHE